MSKNTEQQTREPEETATRGGRPAKRRPDAAASATDAAGAGNRHLTPEERHQMIAVAAYYRAECRGFAPGCEQDDWLAAEEEIDEGSA